MAVAEAAADDGRQCAVTAASRSETSARPATIGVNTTAMITSTTSTLAVMIVFAGSGAVVTRSAASSPEIVSQARPPAS